MCGGEGGRKEGRKGSLTHSRAFFKCVSCVLLPPPPPTPYDGSLTPPPPRNIMITVPGQPWLRPTTTTAAAAAAALAPSSSSAAAPSLSLQGRIQLSASFLPSPFGAKGSVISPRALWRTPGRHYLCTSPSRARRPVLLQAAAAAPLHAHVRSHSFFPNGECPRETPPA